MTVQVGLCRTCSETTLLVFPRGGSYIINNDSFDVKTENRQQCKSCSKLLTQTETFFLRSEPLMYNYNQSHGLDYRLPSKSDYTLSWKSSPPNQLFAGKKTAAKQTKEGLIIISQIESLQNYFLMYGNLPANPLK